MRLALAELVQTPSARATCVCETGLRECLGGENALEHGLDGELVPQVHVEDLAGQRLRDVADQREAVDGAGGIDRHRVDEGDKRQPIA